MILTMNSSATYQQAIWGYWVGSTSISSADVCTGQFAVSSTNTITTVTNSWQNTQLQAMQSAAWYYWHQQEPVEQQAARVRRQRTQQTDYERAQAIFKERERESQIARGKAKKLLVEHLSKPQRLTYETRNYFDVELEGKTYRIHQGTHGNVRLLGPKGETVRYCAQPDGVPAEDAMLAQKLMLETDEAAFLKVANAAPLMPY